MALSTDILAYLGTLELAGGDHDGEPFEVLPWEKRFVRGAFRTSGDAALTVARGNGKSGLVAGIACAVADPVGPLHGRRREVVCVASSFTQGRVVFEDCVAMLRTKTGLPSKAWRLQDSANVATIEHRESGARIRCIGSDPKRAHGLRPALAIMDEPGQYDPARAERMLAAMRTGLGKVPRSKLIALGTLPDHLTHWFARMFGTAGYSQMHRADPGADPFSMAAIRAANPSWNHLPSLRERVRRERTEARTDPAALASYLALRLNMGTPDIDRPELIAADRWEAAEAGAAEAAGPYALGIDLGQTAAMTAAAGFWPATGLLRCVAAFPSIPGLAQRGARDGVGALYKDMAERGELLVYPGHIVPVEAFLRDVLGKWGPPNAVAADRYKEGELRQGLSVAKVPLCRAGVAGAGVQGWRR